MRIRQIEISKFKGFYDTCVINLKKSCKNLLVYGENGSGKSSLYHALNLFLESGANGHNFNAHRNIFSSGNDGYIKITLRDTPNTGESVYEWSPTTIETNEPIILEANKTKGFLDYKSLLETYFLHREENSVNLFDLLIKNLLANTINDITGQSFSHDWDKLLKFRNRRMTKNILQVFERKIGEFNQGLLSKLDELKVQLMEILHAFEYDLDISLDFNGIGYNYIENVKERHLTGQEIILQVKLRDKPLSKHHTFLNEAKLSAIALSIYLASLKLIPPAQLQLLVLDDVLIGLDMSNRLPILKVLEDFFHDYQIIITTYDRQWYEMVRLRTLDKDWEYVEFYVGRLEDFEIPIYINAMSYISKARQHLREKDYKACAVYIRTAFEEKVKKLSEAKKLKVKYSSSPERISIQEFWDAINDKSLKPSLLSKSLVDDIELYRKFILNPLSHSQLINIYEQELENAILAVENLIIEINKMI